MRFVTLAAFAVAIFGLLGLETVRANTLETVRERGRVECGVSTGLAGFSEISSQGVWRGLDVDFCRAVAAAVFGDATRVNFTPLNPLERFTALQSGEVDLLSRNTSYTLSRDAQQGVDFVAINYFDGQGFIVPRDLGVENATDLDGAVICVQTGTTTELNLGDYFRANGMSYETIVIRTFDEARNNYNAGACDAYTTDVSGLAGLRTTLADPSAHVILPQVISKEPLGPVVREGDDAWADVVRWSFYAMLVAEELGLEAGTVATARDTSPNPEVRRLLGQEGSLGSQLGLSDDWAFQIISQVGNYGETFEKNLGGQSQLGLERGLNALWTQGGLHYAPPVR